MSSYITWNICSFLMKHKWKILELSLDLDLFLMKHKNSNFCVYDSMPNVRITYKFFLFYFYWKIKESFIFHILFYLAKNNNVFKRTILISFYVFSEIHALFCFVLIFFFFLKEWGSKFGFFPTISLRYGGLDNLYYYLSKIYI